MRDFEESLGLGAIRPDEAIFRVEPMEPHSAGDQKQKILNAIRVWKAAYVMRDCQPDLAFSLGCLLIRRDWFECRGTGAHAAFAPLLRKINDPSLIFPVSTAHQSSSLFWTR